MPTNFVSVCFVVLDCLCQLLLAVTRPNGSVFVPALPSHTGSDRGLA